MATEEQIRQCVNDAKEVFKKWMDVSGDKFNFLGCGHFSDVYEHKETGLAVKFCGFRSSGLDAYPVYVGICNKHKDNPHTPNIHHMYRTPTHYFCVTDRYYECADALYDYVYDVLDDVRFSTKQPNNQLEELLLDLLNAGESMDLHCENVMQTLDGTPVVTDPYSFC